MCPSLGTNIHTCVVLACPHSTPLAHLVSEPDHFTEHVDGSKSCVSGKRSRELMNRHYNMSPNTPTRRVAIFAITSARHHTNSIESNLAAGNSLENSIVCTAMTTKRRRHIHDTESIFLGYATMCKIIFRNANIFILD